jgi:ABC-type phosphate transport system permease subunit
MSIIKDVLHGILNGLQFIVGLILGSFWILLTMTIIAIPLAVVIAIAIVLLRLVKII